MELGDPKKAAAAIVSKYGPKEDDQDDSADGLQAAAEEVLEAFEKKDASLLADALESFVQLCKNQEPESSDQE